MPAFQPVSADWTLSGTQAGGQVSFLAGGTQVEMVLQQAPQHFPARGFDQFLEPITREPHGHRRFQLGDQRLEQFPRYLKGANTAA